MLGAINSHSKVSFKVMIVIITANTSTATTDQAPVTLSSIPKGHILLLKCIIFIVFYIYHKYNVYNYTTLHTNTIIVMLELRKLKLRDIMWLFWVSTITWVLYQGFECKNSSSFLSSPLSSVTYNLEIRKVSFVEI